MTRIKYILKNKDNKIYVSSKSFKVGRKSYFVMLDEKNLSYDIKNVENDKIILSGHSNTPQTLKRNVKDGLKSLGIRFKKEHRDIQRNS